MFSVMPEGKFFLKPNPKKKSVTTYLKLLTITEIADIFEKVVASLTFN